MFDSDLYTVKQKLVSIGNKYRIYESGDLILRSKQKKFKLKEDFRFYDTDDSPVLKVTTDQILDVAASYTVVDESCDETVGAIKRNWTFLRHEWELIDSQNRVIGTIEEDSLPAALARRFVSSLIPYSYNIESQDGEFLGELKGKFSFNDTYELDLSPDENGKLDRRLGVAAAVLIDAVEEN